MRAVLRGKAPGLVVERECWAAGHAVVLNSFGVDTRRVVVKSVPDETDVLFTIFYYFLYYLLCPIFRVNRGLCN